MTRQEWIKQAEELEQKSRDAYDRGDELAGEMYERTAAASRFAADFAADEAQS